MAAVDRRWYSRLGSRDVDPFTGFGAFRMGWIEVSATLEAGKKLIPLRVRPCNDADEAGYQHMNIAHIQYSEFTTGYEAAFRELLRDLPPELPDTAPKSRRGWHRHRGDWITTFKKKQNCFRSMPVSYEESGSRAGRFRRE